MLLDPIQPQIQHQTQPKVIQQITPQAVLQVVLHRPIHNLILKRTRNNLKQ